MANIVKIPPEGWAAIGGTIIAALVFVGSIWRRLWDVMRRVAYIYALPSHVDELDKRIDGAEKKAAAEVEILREEVTKLLADHERRAHAAITEVKDEVAEVKGEVRTVAATMARRDDLHRAEGKLDRLLEGMALSRGH